MNLSLKLDLQHPNNQGEFPLYIRIRKKNKSGKWNESSVFTDLYIPKTHIKDGFLLKKTKSYKFRGVIDSILEEIELIEYSLIKEGLVSSPKLIKQRFLDKQVVKEIITPKVQSFWGGFDEYLLSKKHKSYGYVKTIRTLYNHLKSFEVWKKHPITFDYIVSNPKRFQFEFDDYLFTQKNHTNNYVNKTYENLSQYLHYCKEMGYIEKKPRFSKKKEIPRDEKIYLYKDEVIKLFKSRKWDYDPKKDFLEYPFIYLITEKLEGTRSDEFGKTRTITNFELIKDTFLFLCSVGCRYSDIPHFKVSHFNFDKETGLFTWIQQKTKQSVSVSVNPINQYIFIKYSGGKSLDQKLFPSLSNQKFNKGLKRLLKDLNFNRLVSYPRMRGSELIDTENRYLWELISSHSGRRTFIKNMIDVGDMDYKTIMTMSGHKTFREFEKYISVTKEDLRKGQKLYQLESVDYDDEVEELVSLFSRLSEEDKKVILTTIKRFL
jgi:integrase